MRPITDPPYLAASVASADHARFLVSVLGDMSAEHRPHLLIAVHPGADDANIRQATDAAAVGSAVADLVEVVGDVPDNELRELFERAAAVVVAGTGRADREALLLAASLGAPLVGPASDAPGWPIIESATGIPLGTTDAAEWAAVLDTLVQLLDLGEFLGAGARQWATTYSRAADRPDVLPFDTM